MSCHPSHVTRFSDSSLYDEVCINCGATDGLGTWGELSKPCPSSKSTWKPDPVMKEWKDLTPEQRHEIGNSEIYEEIRKVLMEK